MEGKYQENQNGTKKISLGVRCMPRVQRFTGSNLAEVEGFFQDVKTLSKSPLGGTLSWVPEFEISGSLTPKRRALTLTWSLISPPAAIINTSYGHVQCLTWIPLTGTVFLVDSRRVFDHKDKIAIFQNMTSKITLLQYIGLLFAF